VQESRYTLLALLVLALCVTAVFATTSMLSPTHADTPANVTKTLTVSGSATVTGIADTYTISLQVVGVNADANVAMQKANTVYNSFADALSRAGYNTSLLTLSSLNIYPEYYYPSNGPAVFQDYRVVYGLQFKESLGNPSPTSLGSKAAGVIEAAVQSGVSYVSGVSFSLSDSAASALKSQALAQAATDAKAKAQTLAQSLGVQVIGVQSAVSTDSYSPPYFNFAGAALESGSSMPQFNAGPATQTAAVTVTFIIG
jgi:uncharacterized protein YggE